jgi:hypothetical protein
MFGLIDSSLRNIGLLPTYTPAPTHTSSPTITVTPTYEPIHFPLVAASDNWSFVIQQAEFYTFLTNSTGTVKPDKGAFLALIGDVKNDSAESGCVTNREWELTDSKTGLKYDYNFYAAASLKELYSLDDPGAFLGTCLNGGEQKRLFVVFDINPNSELTLTFRKPNNGLPVQLHTGSYLMSVPTATATLTPTITASPIATNTPLSTITFTPEPTAIFTLAPTDSTLPTSTTTSAFTILVLTSPVQVGGNATVKIQTVAGASCFLSYTTPAGTDSQATGLGATTAGANGVCSWTWNIGPKTKRGKGSLAITANGTTQYLSIVIQ